MTHSALTTAARPTGMQPLSGRGHEKAIHFFRPERLEAARDQFIQVDKWCVAFFSDRCSPSDMSGIIAAEVTLARPALTRRERTNNRSGSTLARF